MLLGVVDFLLERLPLTTREVGVRLRGRPPASGGQVYYGIFPTLWSHGPSTDQVLGLDTSLGYTVALTMRTGIIPDDRLPLELILTEHGFYDRLFELVTWLHVQRHLLLCSMNAYLSATSQPPIIEPFVWSATDPEPRWEGPEWFSADPTAPDNTKNYGLVSEVRFTGGRHLQASTPVT